MADREKNPLSSWERLASAHLQRPMSEERNASAYEMQSNPGSSMDGVGQGDGNPDRRLSIIESAASLEDPMSEDEDPSPAPP